MVTFWRVVTKKSKRQKSVPETSNVMRAVPSGRISKFDPSLNAQSSWDFFGWDAIFPDGLGSRFNKIYNMTQRALQSRICVYQRPESGYMTEIYFPRRGWLSVCKMFVQKNVPAGFEKSLPHIAHIVNKFDASVRTLPQTSAGNGDISKKTNFTNQYYAP